MFFDDLYSMFEMAATYEKRKVDNTKTDVFEVDTALVTDRKWIYETAVRHKDYNDGEWIVVEGCYDKETAQVLHNKWVNIMLRDEHRCLTDIWEDKAYIRGKNNE